MPKKLGLKLHEQHEARRLWLEEAAWLCKPGVLGLPERYFGEKSWKLTSGLQGLNVGLRG